MERMESKPAILDILQNQLAAQEDTLTKSVSEKADKAAPVCTSQLSIMQKKVLEYLGLSEEVNAELFANQLSFTDKEMTNIESVTKANQNVKSGFATKQVSYQHSWLNVFVPGKTQQSNTRLM